MDLMNRTFITVLLAVAVLIPSLVLSASQTAASLNAVVEQTLNNHPDLLRIKNERVAAVKDIRQARGFFLPTVNITTGLGKERSDNTATRSSTTITGHDRTYTRQEAEYRIRQLLFDGGDTASRVLQRKFDFSTVNFQVSETAERLAFLAVDSYLAVLRQRELVDVAHKDVKAHVEALDKVEKRLQAGAGRKSEVSLVKSRLALAQARLEQAEGDLDDANETYKVIVGVSFVPQGLYLPPMPKSHMPRSLSKAQEVAMQLNPSIAVLNAQYEASIASVQLAQSTYFPVITLEMGGTYNNNLDGVKGHNNDAEAMVRIRYNLYRGGSDKAAISAAKSRKVAALYQTDNVRRDVNEDVALAWNDLQTTADRLPYLKAHRDESLDVFEAYQKQFLLGQRTLFDLLNAQTEFYDARRSFVEGSFDYYRAHFRLLVGMGTLLKSLTGQEEKENYYAFAERDPSGEWIVRAPEDEEHLRKKVVIVKVKPSEGDVVPAEAKQPAALPKKQSPQKKSVIPAKQEPKAAEESPATPAQDSSDAVTSNTNAATSGTVQENAADVQKEIEKQLEQGQDITPQDMLKLEESKRKSSNTLADRTKQPTSPPLGVANTTRLPTPDLAKQAQAQPKNQHLVLSLPEMPMPLFTKTAQTQGQALAEGTAQTVQADHNVNNYHLPAPGLDRVRDV
jgi:outer membrane protein, adhesin transport system